MSFMPESDDDDNNLANTTVITYDAIRKSISYRYSNVILEDSNNQLELSDYVQSVDSSVIIDDSESLHESLSSYISERSSSDASLHDLYDAHENEETLPAGPTSTGKLTPPTFDSDNDQNDNDQNDRERNLLKLRLRNNNDVSDITEERAFEEVLTSTRYSFASDSSDSENNRRNQSIQEESANSNTNHESDNSITTIITKSPERKPQIKVRTSIFPTPKADLRIKSNISPLQLSKNTSDIVVISDSDSGSDDVHKLSSEAAISKQIPVRVPLNPLNVLNVQKTDVIRSLKEHEAENHNTISPGDKKIIVSMEEFRKQREIINTIRTSLGNAEKSYKTVKSQALPDGGTKILSYIETKREELILAEKRLKHMFVEEADLKMPEIPAQFNALKPTSWKDLESGVHAVQPVYTGERGMNTYNNQKALTMDRLALLHNSLKTCPKEDMESQDPKQLKSSIDLMPHQKYALTWLAWREQQKPSGGILADDMGLGKTLTMISHMLKSAEEESQVDSSDDDRDLENLKEQKYLKGKYDGGSLVVCPASLLGQWEGEVKSKLKRGALSIEMYHGPKRESKAKRLAKYDMVVTTYAIVQTELDRDSPLFRVRWRRIILDEGHQIRNNKSATSKAVCALPAKSRWVLTGTPIHNKELDLYALLKFLRCSPFDDLAIWKTWVTNKNSGGQARLNTVISSLMLRRTKVELQKRGVFLPERKWNLVDIILDKEEMDLYHKIMIHSRSLFAQFLHQRVEKEQNAGFSNNANQRIAFLHEQFKQKHNMREVKQHDILVLLLRLRQICCHPSLITKMMEAYTDADVDDYVDDESQELDVLEQLNRLNINDNEQETRGNTPFEVPHQGEAVSLSQACKKMLKPDDPLFNQNRRSSKVLGLLQLIKDEVLKKGDKAVVVSQFLGFLNIVSLVLREENIGFLQLNGTIPVNKRGSIIEDFNNPNHSSKVLLLSLTAGGVGLNLIGGNHLFLLDLHWNPQLELQAQDRIYRVGQKKQVHVYKFMARGTIEERIKVLQDNKKTMAENLLTGANVGVQSKLTINDLKMLFNMS